MGDSKKRPHEVIMEDNNTTKKLNLNQTGGENTYHLKLLIPSVAAGAIIGKGGETIAEVQKNVGARVKMSKPNDFYPGTNERVCLITGTTEGINAIVDFLVEKVKEKPDPNAKPAIDFDNKIAAEREKQMKVLVPNSTAGMIIGKGGNYIKQIKEDSGSFIQISQKSKETTLPERVVTIIGDDDNNKIALELILQKICEDPQSGSCLNISYSEIQGPVANFNPTGSPFAHGPNSQISHTNGYNQVDMNGFDCSDQQSSPVSLPLSGGGSLGFKLNFNASRPPSDPPVVSQSLAHINNFLRNKGYNEKASEEITTSINILALHGVLLINVNPYTNNPSAPPPGDRPPPIPPPMVGPAMEPPMGPGPPHIPPSMPLPPHHNGGITDSIRATMGLPPPPPTPPHPANQGPFGPIGQVHAASINGANRSPNSYKRPMHGFAPLPVNNNSFGLATAGNPLPCLGQPPPPPPGIEEHLSKIDIEVNESLVGAVLGPAGRSIVEIQQYSGAAIQISKKGTYSPGTRNRIVTITGPQKALTTAQYLIEQRVSEEESKRQQNSSFNNMGI